MYLYLHFKVRMWGKISKKLHYLFRRQASLQNHFEAKMRNALQKKMCFQF